MLNVKHIHGPRGLVDAVPHSVGPTPRPPLPLKGLAQRRSHSMRVFRQWPFEELKARRSDSLGQLL
jgi:hypothetical protein